MKKPSAPNKPHRPTVPSKTIKITQYHSVVPLDGLLLLDFDSDYDYVRHVRVNLTQLDSFVHAAKQFMQQRSMSTDVIVNLLDGTVALDVEVDNPDYDEQLKRYKKRKQTYDAAMVKYEKALVQYNADLTKWTEFVKKRELDRARKLIEEHERSRSKRDEQ